MIAVLVGRKFGEFTNVCGEQIKFAKLYCISQQTKSRVDTITKSGFEAFEAKSTIDEAQSLSDFDILDLDYDRNGKLVAIEVVGKCDPIKI